MRLLTPDEMKQLVTLILIAGSILVAICTKGKHGGEFLFAALLVWIFG